jgi:predicted ATPase/DNA-binding winged helix-turn-helix (wHTH) protein
VEGETYTFGSFQLIPEQRLLLDKDRAITLGSRAMDILTVLVESAGDTVSNAQIMARAWPTTTVDDGSLRVHISALRKALGDGQGGNRFIANIPGRGYTFVAHVRRGHSPEPVPATAPREAAIINNLPTSLVSVIGRGDAISELTARLTRRRLLTIVGPGGIGKTTVAVAVAETVAAAYPGGVWFVALASLPASALVASAISATLGIAATSANPLPALTAWLRDRQALIILDNCEHVVDAAAAVAETIVKAAPQASILSTSREPLRAEGESLYRLPALEVPLVRNAITASEALAYSAVELFNERARAYNSAFALTDADASALCEICHRLDGLPLALELAAAQTEAFGIQNLARGLNDRFALLTAGRRTALGRQQTLRATMDWSYDLLAKTERTVLRRLAIFRGDFTMDAATTVCGDEQLSGTGVIADVANLMTKSLIVTDITGDVYYFHLLETTRAYALDRLAQDLGAEQVRRRHAKYYCDLFAPAELERQSRPQPEWIACYGRHLDNVRSALDWAFSSNGDPQLGVALTAAAAPLWIQLSLLGECRERVERALASLDNESETADRLRMQLSATLGWALMYGVGRDREARVAWTTTLDLAERHDDKRYRRHALWGLCIDQFNNGNVRTALDCARRFAGLVGDSTDAVELMMADRILATSYHYLGDQIGAGHHIDRVLAHDKILSRQRRIVSAGFDLLVSAHYFQARILWLLGFPEQALRVVVQNIEEGQILGQALSFCSVLGQGACPVAFLAGDLDTAERYGVMLLEHTERHPVRLWNIWARCFIGLVTARRGNISAGLRTLREGLQQAGEARYLPRFLILQGEQALYLQMAGEYNQAIENLDQMLARSEARDEGWYLPELLRIKGELLVRRDKGANADELFQRSLDKARRQGALSWELRTATSLARLLKERRQRAEAAALLHPIYARFTEGNATADLQAAGALLDELA